MIRLISTAFSFSFLLLAVNANAQILINSVEITAPVGIAGEYDGGSGYWGVSLADTGPISSDIVLIDDGVDVGTDGCEPPTAESAAAINGNIALIDRGTCSMVNKPFNAQQAGAIAVIIINNRPGDPPYQGGGFEGTITIPTVFVTDVVGASMKANLTGLAGTISGEVLEISAANCVDGMADVFPCDGIDFMANMERSIFTTSESVAPSAHNDIWGWTDPQTGREYALVGLTNGTAFVDVTTPSSPVYIGKLPTETEDSSWRDIKTYANHAFIVAEASGHGMQVFDLTRLRASAPAGGPVTFDADAVYTNIGSAHNVVINEDSGFAYAVGARLPESFGLPAECDIRGFHAIDISTPTTPTFASCFSDIEIETGPRSPGYTHDAQCVNYTGPDADHAGSEICLGANEDVISIFDVTNKANVVLLSSVQYPNWNYTHQGWLTEDQQYFIVNDELDELVFGGPTRTLVFDVSDLDNPEFSFAHAGPNGASDHNLYVHDGLVYQSNYRAGLRILDATGIGGVDGLGGGSLAEVASFDTWPESDGVGTSGQWSNYPFFPSGTIVVNDTRGGLFVLRRSAIPVELVSFSGVADGDLVTLSWTTSSETNNAGFEVQLQSGEDWETMGFVEGNGSTTEAQSYSFTTEMLPGTHTFRIRQIDFDGQYEVHGTVEVVVGTPGSHLLSSVYPNPFNPQTSFNLSVAQAQIVTIELYNILGQRVATVFDAQMEANTTQSFTIDGAELASGQYVVRVRGDHFAESRTVTLLK